LINYKICFGTPKTFILLMEVYIIFSIKKKKRKRTEQTRWKPSF